PNGATGTARYNMAGHERRMTYRIVGSRGEATATNFVEPHLDDRVIVKTAHGERVEQLGKRSSYTYQLQALRAVLRHRVPLPIDLDDAVDTMHLIDDCYRAAGLTPRPRATPSGRVSTRSTLT